MQVDGKYGKTGSYSVTMTVEVQAVGEIPPYSIIVIDSSQPAEPAEPQSNPNTGDNSMMWLCIALLVVSGTCMAASLIHNRKNSMSD